MKHDRGRLSERSHNLLWHRLKPIRKVGLTQQLQNPPRTGIFPIMHVLGLRRELAERHPWLPDTLVKAFGQAKAMALDLLADTSATKVTLPFVEEQLRGVLDDTYKIRGLLWNSMNRFNAT